MSYLSIDNQQGHLINNSSNNNNNNHNQDLLQRLHPPHQQQQQQHHHQQHQQQQPLLPHDNSYPHHPIHPHQHEHDFPQDHHHLHPHPDSPIDQYSDTGWGNESYMLDYSMYQPPSHLFAIMTMLYVAIFILGLLGNISVIVVVFHQRSMRTSINKLFLNLCIADLLALLITGPTVVVDMYMKEAWHLGPVMCKLVTFLENVVAFASAAIILAISVERYRVACRASTNDSRLSCNQLVSFFTIWGASLLGAVPILEIVSFESHQFMDGTPVHRCRTPIDVYWKKVYIVVTSVLFFILPLLLILCLYLKVYLRLMQLFKREQRKKLTYPREIVRLKRQMTQIIITVVLVFFICHTPFRAFVLWSLFAPASSAGGMRHDVYLTTVYVTRMLLYSNHAINPFVYNFVSRKFRRALLWLFLKKKRNTRFNEWKELVNTRRPIRMESFRRNQQRPSTAGRLFDIDNNCIRDKMAAGPAGAGPGGGGGAAAMATTTMMDGCGGGGCGRDNNSTLHQMHQMQMHMLEPDALFDRHSSHFQRNDFLVLYENLVLE